MIVSNQSYNSILDVDEDDDDDMKIREKLKYFIKSNLGIRFCQKVLSISPQKKKFLNFRNSRLTGDNG